MPPPRLSWPSSPQRANARFVLTWNLLALLLVAAAVVFRAALTLMLPVGYDEVFVMGIGLDELRMSLSAGLFDVPVTHSSAVTPLWWWLQSVPPAVMGELSLFGLRIVPFLLGAATPVIAWYAARRRFGRRTAGWFVAFVALSDVLVFSNSRGEFAESLLTPLIVLCVCMRDGPGIGWRRGLLWLLLLLTALIKGLSVIGLMIAADVVVVAMSPVDRGRWLRRGLISLALAAIPTALYLSLAQMHFGGRPIVHEALTAPDLPTLVGRLLFDYAEVKAHVVGSARNAALLYLDFLVWPVSAATAPLILASLVSAIARLRRIGWSPRGRRDVTRLRLTVWTLLGAAVVIARGVLGGRFHLVYLPAAWMLAALWLAAPRPRFRWAPFMAVAGWAGMVGFSMAWRSWMTAELSPARWGVAFVALAGMATVACALSARRGRSHTAGLGQAALLVAAAGLIMAGPLYWAGFSWFEPLPGRVEMTTLDTARRDPDAELTPHGQTFYIKMANYYLTIQPNTLHHREQALHYALLESRRDPQDARAWAYVGEALFQLGAPPNQIITAWQRCLELAPNAALQARLDDFRDRFEHPPR